MVKTRIQLDPVKYNKGLIGGFKQVIAEEGTKGLATGLGPTVVGYFIQGELLRVVILCRDIFLSFSILIRLVQVRWC